MNDTNEARSIVKLTFFSASSDTAPCVYVFVSSSATIRLIGVCSADRQHEGRAAAAMEARASL
jgi:hypothetical protein